MSTRVRFIGHVDVSLEVPGRPLPLVLPRGLRLERVRDGREIEVQIRAESVTGTFVGRLNMPFIGASGVELAALDVPPPEPWRWGDIRTMLEAASALGLPEPAGTGGLRLTAAASSHASRHAVAWTALNRCNAAARSVLAHWPARTVGRRVLHPLESQRGVELIDLTERRLGHQIDLLTAPEGRVVPTKTMRRVGQVEPWTNRSVAAVAAQVCAAVSEHEAQSVFGDIPTSITAPIRALAHRSMPILPLADPPFSSWPPGFAEAYVAGLRVLSLTSKGGRRSGWVPLSDLWRLYEAWLAERTLAILTRLLGSPTWSDRGSERLACGWAADGWELELHHPCPFTDQPRQLAGANWWSVTSKLDPDVVLVARSSAGVRSVALDAKARGHLTAGELAKEASKYLWGIRRDQPYTKGIDAVVLVAPYGGDEPYARNRAAQWTVHGHPHAASGQAAGSVGTDLSATFFRALLVDQLRLPIPD
jgi:hypothetical protein